MKNKIWSLALSVFLALAAFNSWGACAFLCNDGKGNGTFGANLTVTGTLTAGAFNFGSMGATGTVLRSNGTNWVASQSTYPDLVGSGNVLFATAANTVGSDNGFTYASNLLTLPAVKASTNIRVTGAGSLPADTAQQFAMAYISDVATLFAQGPNSTTKPGFQLILQESDGGGTFTPLSATAAGVTTLSGGANLVIQANGVAYYNAAGGFGGVFNVGAGGDIALYTKNTLNNFYVQAIWNADTTGDNQLVQFLTESGGSHRGSITYNRGGGLVAYNTTSDERAKTRKGPFTNSGSAIDAVPVSLGRMNDATLDMPVMNAHEIQAIAPYAVTGTRGAVDKDGKPVYQQVSYPALIPLLWAEIQSLRARIATLESR